VIPASLLAVAIHSLLDYAPLAIIGHDESVQIEIKALSTLATSRLAFASAAPSNPTRSPIATSSCGVCRECLPLPPQTWIPSSFESGAEPRFNARSL
jgi:hypothetical protein